MPNIEIVKRIFHHLVSFPHFYADVYGWKLTAGYVHTAYRKEKEREVKRREEK